jgi:diguanylate cyclase (GGDEF)-like protein/PAS domain S-box-containing protein
LDQQAATVSEAVSAEVRRYGDALSDLAAAAGALPELTVDDFARLTAPLNDRQLAGATSVVLVVPAGDDEIDEVQERWRARGATGLELDPAEGVQDHLFSITQSRLDGATANTAGIDIAAAAAPERALREARERGRVTVSDTYRLLIDRDLPVEEQQLSFILAAPVSRPADGSGARPFHGWVLMGLRGEDFMADTLAQPGFAALDVTLSARNSDQTVVEVATRTSPSSAPRSPVVQVGLPVAQRRWQVQVDAVETALPGSNRLPEAVAVGGVALSVLLAGVILILATGRSRARSQVLAATSALEAAGDDARSQATLLEAILNSIGDGVGVVDEHGDFLLHNDAAKSLLGIDEDRGGAENWQEHYGIFTADGRTPFPSDDLPLVRALAGECTDQVEMVIRNAGHPDGAVITVSGRPLHRAGGRKGAVAVFHDVTLKHRADVAVRRDRDRSEFIAAVAGTIAAADVDVAAIAESVSVELAARIGDQAAYFRFDAGTGRFNLLAQAGVDPAADATRRALTRRPPHIDDPGWLAGAGRSRETTLVDLAEHGAVVAGLPEAHRGIAEETRVRSLLHVPLLDGDALIGIITVARVRPDPFEPHEVALVEEVALRAGWAMAHAVLFEQKDRTERALEASQDFSSKLLAAMHEGYVFTVEGRIEDVNDQFCVLTGFTREELIGASRPFPFWPSNDVEHIAEISRGILDVGSSELELDLITKAGNRFPVSAIVRVATNPDGSVNGHITTITDLTLFKERENALVAVAGRDALTELFNRRTIEQNLTRLRPGDAVVVADLDHFKTVNDSHGHAAGDRAIVSFAGAVTGCLRGKDWAGRLGGEEFIIVIRDGGSAAESVIRRIRAAWAATAPLTTFSAGIAVHADGARPDQTLALADGAMYLAKHNGRDRTELADPVPAIRI